MDKVVFAHDRVRCFVNSFRMSLLSILRRPPRIRTNPTIRTFSDESNIGVSSPIPPRLPRPPPGRLSRHPRNDDTGTKAALPKTSTNLKTEEDDIRQSRINERKAAIERRRLMLEKGVVQPMSEKVQKNIEEETNFTNIESNYKESRSPNSSKVARSSVHSLNAGRKLSAVDMHRLQRTSKRTGQAMPQQQHHHQQQQEQHEQQHIPLKRNNGIEQRLTRENRPNQTGGSIVAAQSATTRYRLQRQQQKDAASLENHLKMNPSVISIPLDETSELEMPKTDDFEERLKRLRREKEKEERGGGSSWFGWLWKK